MDKEARAKRTAALEEKKKRLDALRKRREQAAATRAAASKKPSVQTISVGTGTSGGAGSETNLDAYIDGLLNKPAPLPVGIASPVATTNNKKQTIQSPSSYGNNDGSNNLPSTPKASISSPVIHNKPATPKAPPTPVRKVETFEMGTQTDDDLLPLSPDKDETNDSKDEQNKKQNDPSSPTGVDLEENGNRVSDPADESAPTSTDKTVHIMTPEEKKKEISSDPFASFFVNASKKVERLLGAPTLADLLVDADYTGLQADAEEKKKQEELQKSNKDSSFGLVAGRAHFECEAWTHSRDVTDIDWSPVHKELILTGYHMPGFSSSSHHMKSGNSATNKDLNNSTLIRNKALSGSIVPKPGETQADGLALVWSLAMTSRPEHIFTCSSPVLSTKFHPTEHHLVLGGCDSGQLVVWDLRVGRLPVQRSTLATIANKFRGHSHPICSLEVAEGGSGLVTASTDGRVNFWSLANLRDPAESLTINNTNISCLAVAPETNTLMCGDETGGLSAIYAQNAAAASGPGTSGTSSTSKSSSSSRRVVKKINSGENVLSNSSLLGSEESETAGAAGGTNQGHFGMITSVATKILPRISSSSSGIGGGNRSVARGFLRGSTGLVLTCGVDWTTKLWAPAYKDEPLISFLNHSYDYMSDVQWSPTNPGIFATASSRGTLGVWNLANDLDEPLTGIDGIPVVEDYNSYISSGKGSSSKIEGSNNLPGLNKLKWSQDGRRIAVASSDRLYVLGMTDEVTQPKADDETKMMNNLIVRGFLDDQ